jgi:hypothetical protein
MGKLIKAMFSSVGTIRKYLTVKPVGTVTSTCKEVLTLRDRCMYSVYFAEIVFRTMLHSTDGC